jgi:hypothetical protein
MDIIEVMENGRNSLGPAAAIYEECSFLCRSFTETQLSHPSREANMAAHELARHAGVLSRLFGLMIPLTLSLVC